MSTKYRSSLFSRDPPRDSQMLTFFSIDGWKLHKSSDDAKRQLETEKLEVSQAPERPSPISSLRAALEKSGAPRLRAATAQ